METHTKGKPCTRLVVPSIFVGSRVSKGLYRRMRVDLKYVGSSVGGFCLFPTYNSRRDRERSPACKGEGIGGGINSCWPPMLASPVKQSSSSSHLSLPSMHKTMRGQAFSSSLLTSYSSRTSYSATRSTPFFLSLTVDVESKV